MSRLHKHFNKTSKPYREHADSTFTHLGEEYYLNPLLALTEDRAIQQVDVKDLRWVLDYDTSKPDRKAAADSSVPVLVVKEPQHKEQALTVVDGLHRLAKAIDEGKTHIPARFITSSELQRASVE